ncbi:MAG: diaminopimelate decarboxylase [Betaproteobacteria bacterium]|nr:diaminopimelate decarboxylase [Betaproteobacteria bacterium]MDH5343865.1 diaminopimelate decarboxylase [Betaproteobacteria bacterium]
MSAFAYRDGVLHAEDVPLARIAAQYGTPCYVYSRAELTRAWREFDSAFAGRNHLLCYAVKANPSLGVLDVFARLGSGFDIVSGGELARVIAAGGDPRKVVFSGVGKTAAEMRQALQAGILCFNVESAPELELLSRIAGELATVAPVSLRVNPDVDAKTHPYIATGLKENKFGVAYTDALATYRRARELPHLRIEGVDCHIGSQLTEVAPFLAALERVLALVDALEREGMTITHIDLGGGLGIRYQDETPPPVTEYAQALIHALGHRPQKLLFEPGRLLAGNAGVLLAEVLYLKPGQGRNFAIVDAAMNDLMRPALYEAWHDVLPLQQTREKGHRYDVVGPVCESGDFLARDRELALNEGDLIAIASAGAYGMSMSSNYNTRPRAAEVMVDGDCVYPIRDRETVTMLMANERRLPD